MIIGGKAQPSTLSILRAIGQSPMVGLMSTYRPPDGTLMLPSNGLAGQSNGAVLQSV
jgi:hypothetical protein